MKVLVSCLLFLLVVALAPTAHAVGQNGPLYNDPPCPDLDCSATAADNGGLAGGMGACTAYLYCVDCGETLDGKSICVKAYRNAYCKCGYNSINGQRYCWASGACTYKGQRR